jgi:hypothetical protein
MAEDRSRRMDVGSDRADGGGSGGEAARGDQKPVPGDRELPERNGFHGAITVSEDPRAAQPSDPDPVLVRSAPAGQPDLLPLVEQGPKMDLHTVSERGYGNPHRWARLKRRCIS